VWLRATAPPGDYVVLHVEDDGEGIPPDALSSIFEPFYTSKGPDLGTGLGLSSSLGIVRSHGGFLQVRSTPGAGARFSVFLPANIATRPDAPPVGAPAPHDVQRHRGRRVLLVEDDPTVRRVTARLLRADGLDVLEAEDGVAALALLDATPGGVALLLTDLHMPRMDGIDLARRMRSAHGALPVVVATGRLDEEAIRRMADLQPLITLEKPFAAGELRDALARALGGEPATG
jgi:two-component system, cell cycle sensor histidine kinase and response regulator CckA